MARGARFVGDGSSNAPTALDDDDFLLLLLFFDRFAAFDETSIGASEGTGAGRKGDARGPVAAGEAGTSGNGELQSRAGEGET